MDPTPPSRPVVPYEPEQPGPTARPRRRRLARSRRGAAGLGVFAAAVLLWPFAGWSWIPWLAGLTVLVLLYVLRLDGALRGWAPHLAGLVVVGGLMLSSGPWDWALAAALGVLLAGLVRLPQWRLAAAGAVLCVLAGAGWGFAQYRSAQLQRQLDEQRSAQTFSLMGERSPERVLPALLEGIGQGDAVAVCGLMAGEARTQLQLRAGADSCPAAVTALRAALPAGIRLRELDATTRQDGATWVTDGCATPWADEAVGGRGLAVIEVRQTEPPGRSYFISGFRPC